MAYLVNVATLVAIFTVLGVSLNWLLGYGGMFSIAHGAFFGIGAYTFAILTSKHGWPVIPALAAAAAAGGIFGALLGTTAIRVSGEFLIIASFGVQEIFSTVFSNWNSVTGGVNGIILPGPFSFFGLDPKVGALVLTALVAAVVLALSRRIARSRSGRIGNWVRAMRSDEIAYAASGRSSAWSKLVAHMLCFAVAGLIGAIYADFLRFVAPNDFDLNASVLVLTVVAIGGAANSFGPLLGSIVAVGLPQLLTFTPLPAAEAVPIQQLFYGLLLVLFMLFRSNGLLNRDYRPSAVPDRVGPDATGGAEQHLAGAGAGTGTIGMGSGKVTRLQGLKKLGEWMTRTGATPR